MKILFDRENELAPLYYDFKCQNQPQPAYLTLDLETGEVDANYSTIIGMGVPIRVFNGVELQWSVSCWLTGAEVGELIGTVSTLLERVLAGSEIYWEGSAKKGKLTEDALSAYEDISAICDQLEGTAQVWGAEDYLTCQGSVKLTFDEVVNGGETIDAAARRITEDAVKDSIELTFVTKYLEKLEQEKESEE